MIYNFLKSTFLLVFLTMVSCGNNSSGSNPSQGNSGRADTTTAKLQPIVLGADRTEAYLPLLEGKRIGLVGNQTSVLSGPTAPAAEGSQVHLVDSLMALGVELVKVFAPEHGFRGTADAGELIKDGRDVKTGLPLLSLYGSNKKPSAEQLEGVDLVLFDIQDVGARFYTYISTLHYVMEACAENNIPLIVLDRPNPNGHYIDGPVLEPQHTSFVGMHPIPVVHGLTMGEYAGMVNGEGFLKDGLQADLTVVKMENYTHDRPYELPVKPSPNLPNATAISLYPSLCFFEGTNVNEGRGTSKQFQVFGSPFLDPQVFEYTYVPQANEGAKYPKHLGDTCYGRDLSGTPRLDRIHLEWLVEAYRNTSKPEEFFIPFFTKLAGTTRLQEQIEAGMGAGEIRETWQEGLKAYSKTREKYLLYK